MGCQPYIANLGIMGPPGIYELPPIIGQIPHFYAMIRGRGYDPVSIEVELGD